MGNLIEHPSTVTYFAGSGNTATISVRVGAAAGEISVEAASDPSDWTSDTGLDAIVNIAGVKAVTLVGGSLLYIADAEKVAANVEEGKVGLRLRGYDGVDGTVQFEVDSQNEELNASNDNLKYRGLRLVLRDLRHGTLIGAVSDYNNGTAYVIGNKVFYNPTAGAAGTAYICTANTTGNLPTNASYWSVHQFSGGDHVLYARNTDTFHFYSLADSNSEQPIPGDYNSGTTYAMNAKVWYGNIAYKSLVANNTANTPSSSPASWVSYYSEKWTFSHFVGELSYGSSKQSYVFTYTLVNNWGEEGPPADPISVDADYGEQITLHGYINPALYAGYQIGPVGYKIRFYGFVSDSQGGGEYKLIKETDEVGTAVTAPSGIGIAFGHLIESTPAQWGEPIPSIEWTLPPATPLAVAAGHNGMIACITDDYFAVCEPYRGWAWPVKFRKALPFKAVGLLAIPGGWLITTERYAYIASGPIPEQISLTALSIEQAGISQKSMCTLGEMGAAYVSNDGIVIVQGLGASLASGTLFTRKEWQDRYGTILSKMRIAYHDGKLVCLFPGAAQGETSNYQGFTIRFEDGAPTYTRLSVTGSALVVDPLNDQLLVGGGTGFKSFETGTAMPLTWHSKEFILAKPDNLGAAMIEYTGGPVNLDTHVNGTAINMVDALGASKPIILPYSATRTAVRFRLPGDFKAERYSFYFTAGIRFPTWAVGTTYALLDVVYYAVDGRLYLSATGSNVGNTPSTSPFSWTAGAPVISDWSPSTTYAVFATVWEDGVYYHSIQNSNTNHTPSASPLWWTPHTGISIETTTVHRVVVASTMAELARA